jgi:hypothetical protein
VLPNAHRLPTELLQRLVYKLIPNAVALELSFPKLSITGWNFPVIGTSVPKASINKNRDA